VSLLYYLNGESNSLWAQQSGTFSRSREVRKANEMLAQESVVVFLLHFLQEIHDYVHDRSPIKSLFLCNLGHRKNLVPLDIRPILLKVFIFFLSGDVNISNKSKEFVLTVLKWKLFAASPQSDECGIWNMNHVNM